MLSTVASAYRISRAEIFITCLTLASHGACLDRKELLKRWEVLDTRLSQAIEEIPQDKVTVKHIKEEPFEVDVMDFFLQYLIHTAHHRGQLSKILSQMDLEVPGTDYIMFLGEIS